MRFDFNEINILNQSLYNSKPTKNDFLTTLRTIHLNTEDHILKDSLQSLVQKISALSAQDFSLLCGDIDQKKLVATMNTYRIGL